MLEKKDVIKIQKELQNADTHSTLMFQALGDRSRFLMLKLLAERKGLCVTDIANVFGTTVSAASQHLKVLERAGLVKKSKTGQTVCYTVSNNKTTKSVLNVVGV